jgi:hypothetical protein
MVVKDATGVLVVGILFLCCAVDANLQPAAAQDFNENNTPLARYVQSATKTGPMLARPGNSRGGLSRQNASPRVAQVSATTLQPVPDEAYQQTQPRVENGDYLPAAGPEMADCAGPGAVCDDGSCDNRCFSAPTDRCWVRADFLFWWTNGEHLPPLVTTGGDGTLHNSQIAFGNSTVNWEGQSGWRITAGKWLDGCHNWALEGDYFNLCGNSTVFAMKSTAFGNPSIFRPFYDVNPPAGSPGQSAEVVSRPVSSLVGGPPGAAGGVTVEATDYFQSAGAWLRHPVCGNDCGTCCDPCGSCGDCCAPRSCRVDLIAGYRYYGLYNNVDIHENLTALSGGFVGFNFDVRDTFHAENQFHGGEVGLALQTSRGRWSLGILTKVAMGNNHQTVVINGRTTVINNTGQSQTLSGGLLAQPATTNDGYPGNIGTHVRDDFVMIPNLNLELGYQLSCRWRAYVGYDALYWASVERAADQIDLNVDSARIPSADQLLPQPVPRDTPKLPFPAFPSRGSNFWAHGIKAGFEFRY